MNAKNIDYKSGLQQKLLFDFQKFEDFKEIINTSFGCQLHQNIKPVIIINHLSFPSKQDSFYFVCQQCINLQKMNSYFLLEDISEMIHITLSFQKQTSQEETIVFSMKQKIKEYLCMKKIRKIKWVTFYQSLSEKIRQFFSKNNTKSKTINQFEQEKQSTSSNYMNQLKYWIINPDLFKQTFLMECSKILIQKILWIKHNIYYYLNFLKKILIKYCITTEQMTEFDVLQMFSSKNKNKRKILINRTKQILKHHKQKIIDQKLDILKKTYLCLKMQSTLDNITQDLCKFIKLYKNIQEKNSSYKFNMLKNNFTFYSNIIENIISLRQSHVVKPSLKITFEPVQYQSEFQNLNNGEFVFNNQYRADTFYNKSMELNRNKETLIGREYLCAKNKQTAHNQLNMIEEQIKHEDKIIQLSNPMRPNQKIVLKLRLNFELEGNLRIGVKWSSFMQNYLADIHDESDFIKVKIIPDTSNDNKRPLKSKQISNVNYQIQQQSQNSKESMLQFVRVDNSQYEKDFLITEQDQTDNLNQVQNQQQQEIIYQVIEDDQISLKFNGKTRQLTYFNQTQKKRICIRQIEVEEWFEFQKCGNNKASSKSVLKNYFPLYVSIALETSIPEIQVLENGNFHQ